MQRRPFLLSSLRLAAGAAALSLAGPGLRPAAAQSADIPDMTLGDENAPVTMIEYASFTCPHCANFHADTFKRLKDAYIYTGKVRFVYLEVYFDRYGLWASMVARCGDGARFFGIAEMIYDTQRAWTSGDDPATIAENLKRIGRTAGLDNDTLDACMTDAAKAESLVAWYRANAEADGIEATPSFMIDGQPYSNMSFGDFSDILDKKLEGAG